MTCKLVKPSLENLPAYKAALERGWSPDDVGGQLVGRFRKDAAYGGTEGLRFRITL